MNTDFIDAIQEPLLGLLGLGLSYMALYIFYKIVQNKNRERLALIEKGMDPSLADSKAAHKPNNVKSGLMLIGIALGVITGYILTLVLNIPNFVAYSVSILVFCGILLLIINRNNIDR